MPPPSTTKTIPSPPSGSTTSSETASSLPGESTPAVSPTSPQLMLLDLDSGTSSQASAAGPTLRDLPESPMMPTSGPEAAPANRSPTRARGAEHATLDIFGQHGSHSSESVALQRSLESKLRVAMASLGSTLFDLTWNDAVTPSGHRICARRASARRTSASDSTSWPTPVKEDARSSARPGYMITGNQGTTLLDAARLASWPTTSATVWKGASQPGQRRGQLSDPAIAPAPWATPIVRDSRGPKSGKNAEGSVGLSQQSKLAGWATPVATEISNTLESYRAMKANMTSGARTAITHSSLQAQLVASGPTPNGSPASTGSRGQLNPDLSRWLMGFPAEWGSCAATETRSSPKSPPSSSKPRKKRGEI